MKPIYLDHASTTPVAKAVLKAMTPYFSAHAGNPSSFHSVGLVAKNAVASARASVAKLLNAHEDEIIFTSGGTESDNLAVIGVPRAYAKSIRETHGAEAKPHVITSVIEHHAVLEPLLHAQKIGDIELTTIGVDREGRVNPRDIVNAIKPTTVLVSIMSANNEIGTIEPIQEIGKVLLAYRKERKTAFPFFHTDACQSAGALEINVEVLHTDLLTMSASKIYGPKGVGVLYVRRGTKVEPLVRGGGQERGIRSGTENVAGIVGLAKAFELACAHREKENARLTNLRDRLIKGLLAIPKSRLNGHVTERLPNNVNVSFLDIEGEAAVLYLDAKGIMTSTGSACASTSLDPSHVILATGLSYEAAHGSIRFTLGASTTKRDIDYVIKVMPGIVERLREMSPTNLDMKHFD